LLYENKFAAKNSEAGLPDIYVAEQSGWKKFQAY